MSMSTVNVYGNVSFNFMFWPTHLRALENDFFNDTTEFEVHENK